MTNSADPWHWHFIINGYRYSKTKIAKHYANTGDPNQTLNSVASDLGHFGLKITILRVSSSRVRHKG